jgi:hypothetical protein
VDVRCGVQGLQVQAHEASQAVSISRAESHASVCCAALRTGRSACACGCACVGRGGGGGGTGGGVHGWWWSLGGCDTVWASRHTSVGAVIPCIPASLAFLPSHSKGCLLPPTPHSPNLISDVCCFPALPADPGRLPRYALH